MTVRMVHATPYEQFQTTGANYTADANGIIAAVALGDVLDMINSGCDFAVVTGTFDGIVGGTTPAAGTFTTVNATGLATLVSATFSGYFQGSCVNGLTAVGTNRATALQLAKQYNSIGTAASTAVGVILPVGVVGMEIDINLLAAVTAASIHVYASGSETIDTAAGSTGVLLTKAKVCRYKFVAALTWESMLWGAVSA